jgi:hypothetical protein
MPELPDQRQTTRDLFICQLPPCGVCYVSVFWEEVVVYHIYLQRTTCEYVASYITPPVGTQAAQRTIQHPTTFREVETGKTDRAPVWTCGDVMQPKTPINLVNVDVEI